MTSIIRDKVLRFRGFETKKLVVHVQCGRTSKMGALKHIILLLCITISFYIKKTVLDGQIAQGNYGWELLSKYLIIQRENFNLFLYSEFSETKTNKLRKEIGIFAHIAQWARL